MRFRTEHTQEDVDKGAEIMGQSTVRQVRTREKFLNERLESGYSENNDGVRLYKQPHKSSRKNRGPKSRAYNDSIDYGRPQVEIPPKRLVSEDISVGLAGAVILIGLAAVIVSSIVIIFF